MEANKMSFAMWVDKTVVHLDHGIFLLSAETNELWSCENIEET